MLNISNVQAVFKPRFTFIFRTYVVLSLELGESEL